MKKAVTLIMTVLLAASVFAENIFEGKRFSTDGDKDLYKFKKDKTFEYAREEGIIFGKYKLDEKKKTIAISMEKLPVDLFNIPGLSGKTLSKSEIISYISDKDFGKNMINLMLEEKLGGNPGIDVSKEGAADEIVNYICFKELSLGEKVQGEFDKNKDYKKILFDTYNEMSDYLASDSEFESMMGLIRKEIDETLKNAKSTDKKLESGINRIFDTVVVFDYSKADNGNILLKEKAKNVPVKNLFYSINDENYEKRICINNGLLAVIEVTEDNEPKGMTFYATTDSFKKDSGKITFVSTNNKKDKIQATYSVTRTDTEAVMTINFVSEKFSDAEFKSSYTLSEETLIEQK